MKHEFWLESILPVYMYAIQLGGIVDREYTSGKIHITIMQYQYVVL